MKNYIALDGFVEAYTFNFSYLRLLPPTVYSMGKITTHIVCHKYCYGKWILSYAYTHKYIFAFEKITDKMGKELSIESALNTFGLSLASHISRIHNSISNECYKEAAATIDFGGGVYYIEEIFFMVKCS